MRQLRMFSPAQQKCIECRTEFVPFSKEMIREWDRGLGLGQDWRSSSEWAIDAVYRENLKCCGPKCLELHEIRRAIQVLEREDHKIYGKRR